MPYYIRSKDNDIFLYVLTFFFVLACYLTGYKESGAGILAFVTFLFLIFSNFKFEFYPFHLFVLQFCLFCYASSMWAFNYHASLTNGFTILQLLICFSVMYSHFKKMNDVTNLMKILMWGGYVVVFYSYFFYGIERVVNVGDKGRLGNSFNNINTLSMFAATVVVINLFFIIFRRASKLYLLVLIPTVIFVVSSQSRKAAAIIVMGYLLLAYMRNLRGKQISLVPFLRFVGLILLLVVIIAVLSSTSLMTGFFERMMGAMNLFIDDGELDSSTEVRVALREIGWTQFLETPWFGMGMGNSKYLVAREMGDMMYLHDNYVEMAASGGIFGLISYYSMYVYLLVKEMKYIKKDDMAMLVLTLVTIRLIIDLGSVSYYAKINYFQLMIYYLHLESCRVKYPEVEKKYSKRYNVPLKKQSKKDII